MRRILLVCLVTVSAVWSAEEKRGPEVPWTPEERMQELEARVTSLEKIVGMLSDELLVKDGRYMIKAGDTALRIARRFELTITDLTQLNPDTRWDHLKVGQIISIKEKKPNQPAAPTRG